MSRLTRIYRATANSWRGLVYATRSEAALREELAVSVLAVPIGFFIAPSAGWYVAMLGVLVLVLAVELINTAIEKLADHVTPEWNDQVGKVKDIGSAAVFCALVLAGFVWVAALTVRLGLV